MYQQQYAIRALAPPLFSSTEFLEGRHIESSHVMQTQNLSQNLSDFRPKFVPPIAFPSRLK